MNKTILIFLLSFTSCFYGNAQEWIKQESNSPTYALLKVHFVNSQLGFVVGTKGLILKTEDGGEHWVQKPSGTSNTLRSVYLVDSITGFAITGNEILKTIDGGENWFSQDTLDSPILRDIQFVSQDTGFIVGVGQLIKTTDKGNNWIAQKGPTFDITDFCATDSKNLFVTGEDQLILKSKDSGEDWNLVNPLFSASTFNSICFASSNVGYAVGGGRGKGSSYETVAKTTNGGQSWSKIYMHSGNGWLESVHFVNESTGYATSAGGEILKTTNGGNSWTYLESGINVALKSIYFPDSVTGYAVGYQGNILKTTIGTVNVLGDNIHTNLDFYPNPVLDNLMIEYNLLNNNTELSICDVRGAELLTKKITEHKTQINLSMLKKGLYIVKIASDKNVETFKIIKQ